MTKEILITNDDSISAEGIKVLVKLMRRYGDVTVISPRNPQSAKGTSLTMETPLHLTHLQDLPSGEGLGSVRVFTLDGTPTDCTKMGMNLFIDEGRMPDFLASGINHGSNASAAVLYSGTVGAAIEAAIYGIPSIAFSIATHDANPDFSIVEDNFDAIMERFLKFPPRKNTYLNVNFPDRPAEECRGIRFATQGRGRWIKEFAKETNPRGAEVYWMVGEFLNLADGDDCTDDHLLNNDGIISIVPHHIDTTDYAEYERLARLWDL
ncbi:MAG: 5'/3'-nucleotidase SurE [Bacteroidales bacterium]|nr:5'/3'-nucleotidase SurE [Bacteroidales bacterium]